MVDENFEEEFMNMRQRARVNFFDGEEDDSDDEEWEERDFELGAEHAYDPEFDE